MDKIVAANKVGGRGRDVDVEGLGEWLGVVVVGATFVVVAATGVDVDVTNLTYIAAVDVAVNVAGDIGFVFGHQNPSLSLTADMVTLKMKHWPQPKS